MHPDQQDPDLDDDDLHLAGVCRTVARWRRDDAEFFVVDHGHAVHLYRSLTFDSELPESHKSHNTPPESTEDNP